jgi:hypothetical protein
MPIWEEAFVFRIRRPFFVIMIKKTITMKRLFIKKVLRFLVPGLLVTFIAIQFIPVDRSNPPVESEIPAPPAIRSLLRNSCYDCHSNEVVWPWYSNVAPISWLVATDVEEGRKELNFSTWSRYNAKKQTRKLKEIWEEIEEGEMPPSSYVLMHSQASLSSAEQEILHLWTIDSTPK